MYPTTFLSKANSLKNKNVEETDLPDLDPNSSVESHIDVNISNNAILIK